jgi:hypothetical protein
MKQHVLEGIFDNKRCSLKWGDSKEISILEEHKDDRTKNETKSMPS